MEYCSTSCNLTLYSFSTLEHVTSSASGGLNESWMILPLSGRRLICKPHVLKETQRESGREGKKKKKAKAKVKALLSKRLHNPCSNPDF